ncbi:Histidine kinase superfamily protein [Desulfonema limicola]|uniref:Oxygen sensor histidine kinase NreB n=1 Tax=Desulfonema limicola TaxID=45656 RepID=A0A975BAS6_9BACT|nr:sensor histidine kinase [Desulfonema limicola]QTA82096.1 Histidine kinase superfamily protein [Desulfonema limicola]
MKWLKSETGVRCLAAFSFLLIFSMGVLIYETMELVSDFKQHILVDQNDNSIVDKDFDPDLLVQKRINRFVSAFLLLLLGMTIIVLVFSLKQFNKTGLPHIDKKNNVLSILDSIDELDELDDDSHDGSFNKMFEALQKVNDLEDDIPDEAVNRKKTEGKNEGFPANSYNKLMETLQKLNELEKKHTIELAAANELLENEITEREKAEKEIRHLSRKLISGIEDAQKKLAQDLHDEFGQTLAALHMGVETLLNSMPQDMVSQRKHIDDLIIFIENLGDKIRSISSDLRPDLLDDLGLVPTLEWYIKEFSEQRSDININFQAVGFKKRLCPEIELVFYRIFQESLNNVVKHSKADNVDVMLTYSYPKAILMVKDNGTGFDIDKRSGGIGLIGMRERAVSIKGQVDIRSEKGRGTTIRIAIPVS